MSDESKLAPQPGGQFLVYQTVDGKLRIDVRFKGEFKPDSVEKNFFTTAVSSPTFRKCRTTHSGPYRVSATYLYLSPSLPGGSAMSDMSSPLAGDQFLVYQTDNITFSIAIRFAEKWHRTATHKESLSVRYESPRSLGPKLLALSNLVDQMPVSEPKSLRNQS
jgi:hypothetical protein